jgi:hypothetical protein
MTRYLGGMRCAIVKEEQNRTAVGETLSLSRHLRNKCHHETIFKDAGIN